MQTEIMRRFLEWQAAERRASLPEADEETTDKLANEACKLADEMAALPSTSAADFALKMCAVTAFGVFDLPSKEAAPLFWQEAETLARNLTLPPEGEAAQSAITSKFREAYENGEAAIMRAVGLSAALYELATEAKDLNGTTPLGHALLTLMDTLAETVKRIADLHTEEWNAARAG